MNCLFPVPDSQPTATELFQSPLYGSGTVFRSISHQLRHFLSSALAWRHTSSSSVTRNYCCRAREVTLSFMDTIIALTYLCIFLRHSVTLQTKKADQDVNNESGSRDGGKDKAAKKDRTHNTLAVIRVFLNVRNGSWILTILFIGTCNGLIWGFLFWHLDNLGNWLSALHTLYLVELMGGNNHGISENKKLSCRRKSARRSSLFRNRQLYYRVSAHWSAILI